MQARKKDAINYLVNSSVFSDQDVINKNFANFDAGNPKQKEAKQQALKVAQEILTDQPVNAIFTGGTGRGKTHLAMAICMKYYRNQTSKEMHVLELSAVINSDESQF
ncbi:ATP-binding protein [Lentilactobacillus kosonis]|uniref:Uncharacterized protein n=1 Tax=Lentilactobacillus kosonis TaxID=2810561 RepID=A0A401FPF8_9LACO|nr:ATP-binding protein [Lentilactobacillus kosonis]GAY74244.1 hypothetical protein NBRC111893_2390 [Lentilactobacillus kosonis]